MKKICLVWLILLVVSVNAVPSQLSFQGILKDSAGSPITGARTVNFSIFPTATGGGSLWTETQTVSAEAGLYNVQLGSVNPVTAGVFDGTTRYLGLSIGGSELLPRVVMVTVPYAYRAEYADTAGSSAAAQNAVVFTPPTQQTTSAATGIWVKNTKNGIGGTESYTAISAEASGTQGVAVVGIASDTTNAVNAGGMFGTSSTSGRGVWGAAQATTGTNYGGYFTSGSTDGRGAYGFASNTSGQNYGGYFRSHSTTGTGVYGYASNSTGKNIGGYFWGNGDQGIGVYGTGASAAGSFESTSGYGVYGRSTNSYGVYGESSGGDPTAAIYAINTSTGRAVLGVNNVSRAIRGETSTGYAISGYASDASGYAGEFIGGLGVLLPDASGATTPAAGTIRWNSNAGKFQGYTGAVWVDFH